MNRPDIDMDQAARYVGAICGEDLACVQVFDDTPAKDGSKAAHRTARWADLSDWAAERNADACGVFLTMQATDGKGRKKENMSAARVLFAESDGHRELPTAWSLEPSLVVQRNADHWHAFWLLQEGEDLDRVVPALTHLAGYWQVDRKVATLERVMRIPGFVHQKAEPCAVTLRLCEPGRRYTIAQVLAAHPVDWAAVPEEYQRQAVRDGLWEKPVQAPAEHRPARQMDESAAVAAFRKWCEKVDTAEGKANHYGGRDAAAFQMACKGHARGIPRNVIEEEVYSYLQRSNFENPEASTKRIVGSACSRPRTDNRPLPDLPPAMSQPRTERAGPRPTFDDAQPPPDEPAAPAEDEPEQPQGPWDNLDLEALKDRWSIGMGGVAPIEWDARKEASVIKVTKRLGNLPLWPSRIGRDVATGRSFLEIGWVTPAGEVRHQWLAEDQVKLGKALLDLPEGPVAGPRWLAAAVWLTEARSAVRNPLAEVTSRLGWCGINGSRRWVWPGTGLAEQARYIGDPLPSHGDLEKWQAGLEHLLTLDGEKAYTALACVALSVAAPWARLVNGKRNPVIGLLARSSSGKGSVLSWALAPWADAEALTLPASSSVKGLQDRAVQYPDLPIFCDELQQMLDQGQYGQSQASEAVYFLANGQRRVTSSKAQVSVGGEARHGVGFYAAEAPILPGLNSGVHYRVVELRGDPCPDEATARCLRQAGQHTGVLAKAISCLVQARDVGAWIELLRSQSAELKAAHAGLEAGDSDVLALLQRGCDVLDQVCGVEMPTDNLVAWLARVITDQRRHAVDKETACLQAVLDWLCNLDWTYEDSSGAVQYRTEMVLQQHLVAWSTWINGTGGHLRASLECDPTQRDLAQIFERFGGERRVLPAWATRGWIEKQGAHLKVMKRGCGRVVRFSRAALSNHIGADDMAPVQVEGAYESA